MDSPNNTTKSSPVTPQYVPIALEDHCSCCQFSTPPPQYPISEGEVEHNEGSLETPESTSTLASREVEQSKRSSETPDTSSTPAEAKVDQFERTLETPEIISTQAEEEKKDKYSRILERGWRGLKAKERRCKWECSGWTTRESVEIEKKYFAKMVAKVEKLRQRDEKRNDKHSRYLERSLEELREKEEKFKRRLMSKRMVEVYRRSHARAVALVEEWKKGDEERGLALAKELALDQDRFRYQLELLDYRRKWRDFVVSNQDGTWRKWSMMSRLAISWYIQDDFGFKIPLTGEIWNGHIGLLGDYEAARNNNSQEPCGAHPTPVCRAPGYYDKNAKQWKCFKECFGVGFWPVFISSEGFEWGNV